MSFLSPADRIATDASAASSGLISLVGAGPGAADLLTLRAVNCLRAADIVFYDRLVDPEALAIAPAHVPRVFVGKEVGAHSWPQARIDAAIVAAALQGQRVVRLKSGDPSIFGRAAEEIAAARRHGIAVEVIPGITAACAAAASLCTPLTVRGETNHLVLATATTCTGDVPENIAQLVQAGASLVFYMAMAQLATLSAQLLQAGLGENHPVQVACNVSKPSQMQISTTVARLQADCARSNITNPAVIMISVGAGLNAPMAQQSALTEVN